MPTISAMCSPAAVTSEGLLVAGAVASLLLLLIQEQAVAVSSSVATADASAHTLVVACVGVEVVPS